MYTNNVMVAAFLEDMGARGLDGKTLTSYNTSINRFLTFMSERDFEGALSGTPHHGGAGGCLSPILATQKDVSNFKKWLVAHYKNSTVDLTLKLVNAFFRWAVEQGYMVDNPMDGIKRPMKSPPVIKWLTQDEQNALLREARRVHCEVGGTPTDKQKASQLRDYAILMTFLRAGLRVEELCDMKLSDLTITARKGQVFIKGKGDKDRTVPLSKELRDVLTRYLDSRKDNPSPFVFPSQRSPQSTTRAVQFTVDTYRKRLGIDHLTCHALRHTFGHELAQAHIPLDVIARLMGHFKKDGTPNIEMTLKYTMPGMADLEKAVEEIAWN